MLPYADEVVAVTVVRPLLFVLHVCMLRECEGQGPCWCMVWMRYGCGEWRVCGWYTWFRYCV